MVEDASGIVVMDTLTVEKLIEKLQKLSKDSEVWTSHITHIRSLYGASFAVVDAKGLLSW